MSRYRAQKRASAAVTVHVFHAGRYPEELGLVNGVKDYVALHQLNWSVVPRNSSAIGLSYQKLTDESDTCLLIGRLPKALISIQQERNIPWVEWLPEGAPARGNASVQWDAASIGQVVVDYFRSCGVRSLALQDLRDPDTMPTRWSRHHAFLNYAQTLGMEVHLIEGPDERATNREQFQDALRALVGGLPRPIGLFAYHDRQAEYLVHELTAIGVRVPEDVLIVGGTGSHNAAYSEVPLSTVRLPFAELGRRAALQGQRVLSGGAPEPEVVKVYGVIERGSSCLHEFSNDPILQTASKRVADESLPIPSVGELATCCGVSRQTLLAHVRREMRQVPEDWLHDCAMNRAANLLSESALSMAEIAKRCGFSHRTYLSSRFKQRFGLSPSAYRKHMAAP